MIVQGLKIALIDVTLIKSDVKRRLNFGSGAMRNKEVLLEFSFCVPGKTFGDVKHNGDSRSSNLVTKSKVFGKCSLISHPVNLFA